MANPPSHAEDRVGPFVAGASSSDLIGLAREQDLGLRMIDAQEQKRDYYRQRCDGLVAAAREFFYDYQGSTSLLFEKTQDSGHTPEFIQYACCWLVQDRLGGLILSGLSSDAGTHEQIDQGENCSWEQSCEIAEALSRKYTQNPGALVNYFNFELYPALPHFPEVDPKSVLSGYQRLVTAQENNESRTRIETHYWGPSVVLASRKKVDPEIATATAHTSRFTRKILCNDQWFVVYNHAIERYVRTIESLHVFTNLVYISRPVMDDVGRTLNAQRGAQVEAEARREIEGWEESLRKEQEAKQTRILKLAQIL
jgi:hypothetical protein